MPSRRARLLLLAGGAIAAALPAIASQPESLLPPGFGDPKTLPPPVEQPKASPPPSQSPTPTPARPPSPTPVPPPAGAQPPADALPQETTDSAVQDLRALPAQPRRVLYDLPPGSARPTDIVGVIGSDNRGLPVDAFGAASGPFLGTLVVRLDAPLPSRWSQILLRRTLMSRVQAPRLVDPVDWVAARVELLLRMGEADAARMLAQSIDVDTYTPNMIRAAFNASLASSDPAGLCPIAGPGGATSDDAVWPMADAMCAALSGEQARASGLLDQARRRGASGIDLLLAEKVVGASSDTRRSVRIQWDPVGELNPWRFGLASATGAAVPDRLLEAAGYRTQAWYARAPMVPVAQRLAAADIAAALGVFSSASMVEMHALAMDLAGADTENSDPAAGQLQAAYVGTDPDARLTALRSIWDGREDQMRRYGRLVMTAGAVARLQPDAAFVSDADRIVASLLSAGMDNEAAAWAGIVEEEGGSSRAWALLAVGSPRPVVAVDSSRINGFGSGDTATLRSQFLVAALAGLNRIDAAEAVSRGVAIDREDNWTLALDRAAASGQPGTVALLAAVGMQAPDWSGIPPEHLFRIVRALRQVGLDFEARMIAAEALTRI